MSTECIVKIYTYIHTNVPQIPTTFMRECMIQQDQWSMLINATKIIPNERGDPDPRVLISIIEDSLSLTMSTTSWSFCPRPWKKNPKESLWINFYIEYWSAQ